jgi:hypothetical protein
LLAVLLPLHQMGFTRALHAFTRTTAGAIRDYRGWQGRYEVWVDVDGIFQLSARRVQARYRVLGLADPATLVVLDPPTGRIHTVGAGKEANLYPYRIRARQGRAITVRSRAVGLTQQLLRDLLGEVPPEGDTYFSRANTPRYGEVNDRLPEAVQRVLIGRATPEQALQDLANQMGWK